ncbi:NAD(P)/FAD-dependent oxidoreductase [Paenibacillus tarimensis]
MTIAPKIVILGAGYGGLMTALRLQKLLKRGEADVTLINKHDYHYLTTHLHMPAAGTDHHDNAWVQITELIRKSKIKFVKATVTEIRPAAKMVMLEEKGIAYDYLIVGLGGEPETFGIPGLKEYAMTIRSINSVRAIRLHIEYMFAKYKLEPHRTELLTFVVGGAGFTGTEFIGELADRVPELCRSYHIDPSLVQMYNIEAAPVALPPGLPPELADYGMRVLERKGVIFKLSTPIKECMQDGVLLGTGERIKAATVVWAGGIRGNRMLEIAGFETARGRVKVDEYLRTKEDSNVFLVGDCSLVMSPEGTPYGPTAQIAIQQGHNAAINLVALIRKRPLKPFVYHYKGTVASLGKSSAVGVIGNKRIRGRIASFMKKVIDIRSLYLFGGLSLVLKKMIFK